MTEIVVALVVASLSFIGSLYAVWAQRSKLTAEAASTSVKTMMEIRDKAVALMVEAEAAAKEWEAKYDSQSARLAYLEEREANREASIMTLQNKHKATTMKLDAANKRIDDLENEVTALKREMARIKSDNEKSRDRISRIKAATDTGELKGDT